MLILLISRPIYNITFNRFVNVLAHGTRPLVSRGLPIMLEGETPHSHITNYMRCMGRRQDRAGRAVLHTIRSMERYIWMPWRH